MRRHLLTLFSSLSLLLCLAALLFWYRSITRLETLAHWTTGQGPANGGIDHQFISAQSRLTYQRSWNSSTFIPQPPTAPPALWSIVTGLPDWSAQANPPACQVFLR